MKVIEIVGQTFQINGLPCLQGLLIVLLVSGCSSSPLPPVERIVTKTVIEKIATEPPRKPDQITASDFDYWETITQGNIEGIINDVEKGDREPLDHMALPYSYYLNMATWMKSVEIYIIAAEEYFEKVEDDYNKIMKPIQ